MKYKNTCRLLTILFSIVASQIQSQTITSTYIQQDTVTYYGTTDTVDYMPIILNSDGNVVVAGNQKISATQYDALMAAQTSNAVNVWSSSYNTSTDKAFMTCSVNDASGNIYSAGGIRTVSSAGVDLLLQKRNNMGVLVWAYTYNGPGNGNDIATGICLEPSSGNIFLTGASDGTATCLTDYVTLKIDKNTGSNMWTSRYNFANSFDVPTGIIFNNTTGKVIVNGYSGSTFSNYEIATVEYNPNNGTQTDAKRTPSSGGEDKPFGFVTDPDGNVYYAGTTYNGSNYDAQISKLDTSLNIIWTHTIDLNGFNDAAMGIDLDDSSNVIVVGTSELSVGVNEMFIAKFTNGGTPAWLKHRRANYNGNSSAEGLRVKAKNHNELFVGASFNINGNQDIAILRFDKTGKQTLEKTYNGSSNGKDQLMDFTFDGDNIFVSARSFNGTNDDNIVITYSYKDLIQTTVTNTLNNFSYTGNNLIVRFHKKTLKMSKVNNRRLLYGTLGDFVSDSTCNKIEDVLDPDNVHRLDAKKLSVYKLNTVFTEPDSLSESRTGEMVKIPEFYASLLIELPSYLNTESASDTLNFIKPDIKHTQLNHLYTLDWVPTDTLYPDKQTSLHPNLTYPNAHINVEKAWDQEKGNSFVRVGVYDSGIETYANPDMAHMTEQYNFMYAGQISNYAPGYASHGGSCAGIIGARSNNTLGVAGIAGGDNINSGATIVTMKVTDSGSNSGAIATDQMLLTAYQVGATGTNVPQCAALNVMNHSYGKKDSSYIPELIQGIDYATQNGVAFIASRGNYVPNTSTYAINAPNQPATLLSEQVMCVGASGTDGHYHMNNTNGTLFYSMRNRNVDFVAPGEPANVQTTYNLYLASPAPLVSTAPTPSFHSFGGTSAAAPHVSGVVALMMSHRNNPTPSWDNLVHEDCEAILKRSATDLLQINPYSETPGYDTLTGYGKINADSALTLVGPQYHIRHIDPTHWATSVSTTTSTIATNTVINIVGSGQFPFVSYVVDIVKIETIYGYPFSTETFIAAWPLHKGAFGRPYPSGNVEDYARHSEIVNATTSSATLVTYSYIFHYPVSNPSYTMNVQDPLLPMVRSPFTLYSIGGTVPTGEAENTISKEAPVKYFNVYPNPTHGDFTIGYSSKVETKGSVRVVDLSGRVVYEEKGLQIKQGLNRKEMSLNKLPSGVYFVNLEIENNRDLVKKLIIN